MKSIIKWGMIGCGDVTEVKSGPAFNKVPGSVLHAVMSRDEAKANAYALRHGVPVIYSDALQLINDPEVNAIYIATPPGSHEAYCLAAIEAGKPVYVEKPMTLNTVSAQKIKQLSEEKNVKLVVAHYRRAQPMFIKIKELIDSNVIGNILHVRLDYRRKPLTAAELAESKTAWRVNPSQSGGGLFHDLAPHQLGLMYYYFGEAKMANGISGNRSGLYVADDLVSGQILFDKGIQFTGSWCFTAAPHQEEDYCEIFGTEGSIAFAVFNTPEIIIHTAGSKEVITFERLEHVQQPMIEKTVQYFLGRQPNPCTAEEGVQVMKMIDAFTTKSG
jgi:predicted dehydrogenase